MPLFELDDLSTPDGRWWTVTRLHAAMLFPNDPVEQSRYVATIASICLKDPSPRAPDAPQGAKGSAHKPVPVDRRAAVAAFYQHGGFRAVADAPGVTAYRDLITRSQGDRFMAGALLGFLLRLAGHPAFRDRASINIAAFVLEEEPPFPGVMNANRKDILAAWSRYKPVAHFCGITLDLHLAAMRAGPTDEDRTNFMWETLFDHTDELIKGAAAYQAFGLAYRLPRSKGRTPLDPETLYRIPPLGAEAGEIPIQPLSERLVDIARRYRAPSRSYY
jgi:hypothetical protein